MTEPDRELDQQAAALSAADAAEINLPDKFTLELQRFSTGLWIITTDAHKGYMHTVSNQHKNLAEGLAEVPSTLAAFLKFVKENK